MSAIRFVTLDVFTDRPFGGNQLAVIPDATGIPEDALLEITREFNFSETTFCYPSADPAHTRRVRIFTLGGEVPFAGHPTIGTATALALREGVLPGGTGRLQLELGVGTVTVDVRVEGDRLAWAEFGVAKLPELGPAAPGLSTLASVERPGAAGPSSGSFATPNSAQARRSPSTRTSTVTVPTPSSSWRRPVPPGSTPSRRASAVAVPIVGWPAKGTSPPRVKMRTRRVWAGSAEG